MRTLFVGGTPRGYETLRALVENGAEIAGVISLRQDEHEIARFEQPIRELARQYALPLYETRRMKDRDYAALIRCELRPDIALVVGCRILLPREIYEIPPLGTLAVHDSLLPDYRGFAPINWTILNGADHTGVTLFYLNERMDGGDIVARKKVTIGPDDTAPEVYERVCRETIALVLEAYPLLENGTAPRTPQNDTEGSFTCSRIPDDGLIAWDRSAIEIHNLIRGLTYPYPGAFTYLEGRKLMVWKAACVEKNPLYTGRIPGRVTGISKHKGSVDVLTGDGILQLLEVQWEGEERIQAATAIHSIRSTLGIRVNDLVERIQTLERQVIRLTGERAERVA